MRFGIGFAAAVLMAGTPAVLAQDAPQGSAQGGAQSDEQIDSAAQAAASTVQEHVNAYRAGSLTGFVNTFSADATVTMNGVTLANGRQEIRDLYRLNFVDGAPKIRIDSSGVNGTRVFLSVAYVFADGSETCCSYSEYEVAGGKITRLDTQG